MNTSRFPYAEDTSSAMGTTATRERHRYLKVTGAVLARELKSILRMLTVPALMLTKHELLHSYA